LRGTSLSKARYLEGLAFGAFLGAVGVSVVAMSKLESAEEWERASNIFFGTVAIFAAWLSLRGISAQTQQNFEIEQDRWTRRLRTSRASLPNAVHDVYDFSIAAISKYWNPVDDFSGDWEKVLGALTRIESCIEAADPISSKNLSKILIRFQILRARSNGVINSAELQAAADDNFIINDLMHTRSDFISDWVDFSHFVESSFDYARGEVDTFEPRNPEADRLAQFFRFRIDQNVEVSPIWPRVRQELTGFQRLW
jgi:hypothetical protein